MREQVIKIRTTNPDFYCELIDFIFNKTRKYNVSETTIKFIDEHQEETIAEINKQLDETDKIRGYPNCPYCLGECNC